MVKKSERARAAQFLAAIASDPNRTIDRVLAEKEPTPFERELVSGVLRFYFSLSAGVNQLLEKPLRAKDSDLYHLMLVGAYQLQRSDRPDHAVVDETVRAVSALRKPWAKGLVNAVLRRLLRQAKSETNITPEQSFDCPGWLCDLVLEQYSNGEDVLRAMLERAPMCLRINTLRQAPDKIKPHLAASDLWFEEGVVLGTPVPQTSLAGYGEGWLSVQDGAAQFAAHLLDIPSDGRWLDACAAPGGKLFHGMERHPTSRATAVELSESRADSMRKQAKRLGHNSFALHIADATTATWWDGDQFDAILLDAPCTGTGTLRRNPDIKLHRSFEQLEEFAALQLKLLSNLWSMLKPGGSLLYCTCSILQQENDEVIGAFLERQSDAQVTTFDLPTGVPQAHGWQLLPTDRNTDGFYYAKLRKGAS